MNEHRVHSGVLGLMVLVAILFLAATMFFGNQTQVFSSAATYDNVQVFISSQNTNDTSFLVSAYNSTGGLVSTSQSQYPAASFELPSGNYLFTVVASQPYDYRNPIPLDAASSQVTSAVAYPIYGAPSEYGYSMVQVSGSTTISITTASLSSLKTAPITVHVNYQNGTAASDANVGASIIGGWYWINEDNVVLSNQTNDNGVATLTVPSVPVTITAWKWVPVNLPQNETTTQVNIGGEIVNVTVYWQPTYVGLAGEALIIPPATSANIILHSQEANYWVMPYNSGTLQPGAAASGVSSTAFANSPSGVPANQYSPVSNSPTGSPLVTQTIQNQIPPLPSNVTKTTVEATNAGTISVLEIAVAISAIMGESAIAVTVRRK